MRSSRRPALLVLLVPLLLAGCTAPGAGALERPPEELPASLDFVPGDSMGWLVVDTDARRWGRYARDVGSDLPVAPLQQLAEQLVGDSTPLDAGVGSWIGATAGVALRLSDVDDPSAVLGFADVRDRAALERDLKQRGWAERPDVDLGEEPADELTLWERRSARGSLGAVGVADDAVVAAADRDALEDILERTSDYAAPERTATSRYTVEALERAPASVVFRGDVVRDQLRLLVADDPAELELTRWVAAASTVNALRDGWLGIAPPVRGDRPRLVGAADWVADLSVVGEPEPVERAVLDRAMQSVPDVAVAVHDPGMYGRDLLIAATANSLQFSTDSDVPGDERPRLLELLDRMDGDGALAWSRESRTITMRLRPDERVDVHELASDVRGAGAAPALPPVDARVEEQDLVVRLPAHAAIGVAPGSVVRFRTTSEHPPYEAAMAAAGRPPRTPVAWLWMERAPCLGSPAAGWLTWDGTERMRFSLSLASGREGARSRAASCRIL